MNTLVGDAEHDEARVYDARTGRRLHDTNACGDLDEDFSGVQEVVFLPHGGMAFSCERLLLYRRGSSQRPIELEPPGTFVGYLAASSSLGSFVLYWRDMNEAGDVLAVRSYS
jgi:hypothetical protein